jgi:hypothetical protein
MPPRLKNFKPSFKKAWLSMHWRQWQALGLMGNVAGGWKATIDLEALIVSTLAAGLGDRRLLLAALEWVIAYDHLVNFSRLKKIGRSFGAVGKSAGPIFPGPQALVLVSELLVKNGKRGFAAGQAGDDDGALAEYRQALEGYKSRRLVALPVRLSGAVCLQLTARSLLGNNARADVLAYLLLNRDGNPHEVSKEIGSDYKNVYLIMEGWRRAGITERRGKADVLTEKKCWRQLLDVPPETRYVNWSRFLGALGRVDAAMEVEPWSGDEYLLSGLFRELRPGLETAAEAAGVRLPEPGRYKGAAYFEPFAGAVMEVLEKLGKG